MINNRFNVVYHLLGLVKLLFYKLKKEIMITGILPDMSPMRDINQVSDGDRLFYEIGHKIRMMDMSYENNWVREGRFKEIDNVNDFIETDKLLTELEYLEHHNFVIIKKQ
jgi:hypothetical protein